MFKKIIAITLALIFCLCAVSCSSKNEDGAPDGMMSVTLANEPFTLYVPQNWTPNTASGYSSAQYTAIDGLSVSARYSASADETLTAEEYNEASLASITDFVLSSNEYYDSKIEVIEKNVAALLDGKDAYRITYKITKNEVRMVCSQTTVKHGSDFITLYTYCPESKYDDTRKEIFEDIREAFKLGKRVENKGVQLVDKDTPDGMKLASNPDLNYRFFVPKQNWICDPENGATEARYDESGNPTVTVTAYLPDTSMKLEDYFPFCEESYKKVLPEYSRPDAPVSRKVDGRNALSYTYTTVVEGVTIKINQTVFIYDSSFYTITYTAIADSYEAHISDVNQMLDNFKFK